jgi:hypothetical protein
MDDLRRAEPWQLAPRVGQFVPIFRRYEFRWALAFVLLQLTAVGVAGLLDSPLLAYLVIILPLLAAFMVAVYREYTSSAWTRAKRAHQRAPRPSVQNVVDGREVALSGVAVLRTPALAPTNVHAIAYERPYQQKKYAPVPSNPGLRPGFISSGGVFTMMVDGVEVRVKLDRFALIRPDTMEPFALTDGARVRVSGVARWVHEMNSMGPRSMGRTLELVSTDERPLVVELLSTEDTPAPSIDAPESRDEPASGVRVALEETTWDAQTENASSPSTSDVGAASVKRERSGVDR